MKHFLVLTLSWTLLFSLSHISITDAHPSGSHSHKDSPGGPLLKGYPWGIFSVDTTFPQRAQHQTNDQELVLANRIFEELATLNVSVLFPLHLNSEGYKPFGDGQANAEASFNTWEKSSPPLLAVLNWSTQILHIGFDHQVSQSAEHIVVKRPNPYKDGAYENEEYFLDNGRMSFKVDVNALGWNRLDQGQPIFVKPQHWNDWFVLKVQYPVVEAKRIVDEMPSQMKFGQIPNPLGINSNHSVNPLTQLMSVAQQNGSDYLVFTSENVHSIYPSLQDPKHRKKSAGGNWTFLLSPSLWQGENPATFKQLYSCFPGRAYWEESMQKSVSGTSWHHVGDTGEIILNSIQNETRDLVAAVAEPITLPPSVSNLSLAYGLNSVGYASLVPPGFAFVTANGKYHWHPVHTQFPICVEVWTPPCKPTQEKAFGFSCF